MNTHRLAASGLVAVIASLCALAAPAAAQSTLADNTCVVVTSDGLFRVENQVTTKLLDDNVFHGGLDAASVTWIDGTDHFIVTTVGSASNPAGVWRVTLTAGGSASLVDLTPTLPPGIGPGFYDTDYSPALDLLFLLEREAGLVASWAHPAQATLATLAPYGLLDNDANAIAIRGARQPFAVVASVENGPLLAAEKLGVQTLDGFGFDDIACQPVTGDLIVVNQGDSLIGILATSSLVINFNVSGLCGPLVAQPADVEWDPVAGRAVAIAAEALPACAFAGATIGENHVVRLPLTALGGPAGNQPVLLTPLGASGITGNRADIALVRHGGSAVTYWGYPNANAGTSTPTFKHEGPLAPGKTAALELASGPPTAAALLLMGLSPGAAQALLPAVTGANGAVQLALKLPASATPLVGLEIYMQWVADDTTTAAPGDHVTSQTAVFTVGVK